MSVPMDANPYSKSACVVGHCNHQTKIGINALYKAHFEEKLILSKMVKRKESLVEALHNIIPLC